MKRYGFLAFGAFAVLAAAAAWLGGLNQDEGWYLYAAKMVDEGRMPYRDFFYTQGPLLPLVYSQFVWIWDSFGLLGARAFTCAIGFAGFLFAAFLARSCVPQPRRTAAGLMVFTLLACNLYHVYYTTIPKTYALASLFVTAGFLSLSAALSRSGGRARAAYFAIAGFSLALAAGTRISLGLLLASSGLVLLLSFSTQRFAFLWFGLGGFLGLAAVYGPFVADPDAFAGLCAAQKYHAARSGFSLTMVVGSLSRLVRWYLPVFVLLAAAIAMRFRRAKTDEEGRPAILTHLIAGFAVVFTVQMLAPVPYDDYNTPIMGIAAVLAAAAASRCAPEDCGGKASAAPLFAAMAMTFACSFGSPLLEKWTTNGIDRFWPIVKEKCEMAQLRDAARKIEKLDPGGKELLTQDLYLAIETGRRVPDGLEMGPFSQLSTDEWREMLSTCTAPVAALSGYSFAILPPSCVERKLDEQLEFWSILRSRYESAGHVDAFGQNATTLVLLRAKRTGAQAK
jgi:hypothetical protein